MSPANRRRQKTLLELIPYLRIGGEADRNAFWVITSIVAGTLLWSVIIDLVLHWDSLTQDVLLFWITAAPLVPAVLWAIVPWVLKTNFPRSAGSIGFFVAVLVACYNIAYSNDAVLATTALHILPICSLYLGWFWSRISAIIQYSVALVLIISSVLMSDLVGVNEAVFPSTAVFGILLSMFAFSIGVYLRYRLRKKALTDQLTGVWNARGTRRRLSIEIERALKKGEALSVAFCDFDNFKELNDQRGHAYGDQVLATTIQQWVTGLRPYDIVGRLGGDEFIVIFPKTTKEQAANILHRIQGLSQHPWTWGLSEVQELDSVDSLLKRADTALYQNKNLREVSPEWAAPPTEAILLELEREHTSGVFTRLLRRQNEFSLVSSMLALVVFGGILASIIGGDFHRSSSVTPSDGWVALGFAITGVILPWILGSRYPRFAGMATAMILIGFYAFESIVSVTLYSGIVLMFALSLVALYLGTFFGSVMARALVLVGMIAVIAPIWNRAVNTWSAEDEPVVLVTAMYSVLMCIVLFELGTYLYKRSRTNAHYDELTGALNRHGLAEYGGAEMSRARRTGQPLSVAVIDCVGFKSVNDTHGHSVGDDLLRELVIYFSERLQPYDHIVRTGGDEFVLMLPYRSRDDAEASLREVLSGSPSRVRYGITDLRADDTLETLITRADKAILTERGSNASLIG